MQAGWNDPAQVPNWHWRIDRKLGGCGMVMDSGAHWVDTMRYWFGEIDSVYARVEQIYPRPHRQGEEIVNSASEDFWTSIFNFASGLIGTWSWTISAPGKGFTQLTLSGEKGSIIDTDIFHPAAFQANGECQLADGTTHSMSELQEMYLATLSEEEKDALFPVWDYRRGDAGVVGFYRCVERGAASGNRRGGRFEEQGCQRGDL